MYPVLALVAVISAVSYLYRWSRGSGRRIVAAILVGALLISQSYFMTASANESALIEEEEEVEEEQDIDDIYDIPEEPVEPETPGDNPDLIDSDEADGASDTLDHEPEASTQEASSQEPVQDGDSPASSEEAGSTGETGADHRNPVEDVDIDKFADTGSTSILVTGMSWQDRDQQRTYYIAAGTSYNEVVKKLPQQVNVTCKITPVTGQAYTDTYGREITWEREDDTGNTDGGSCTYVAHLLNEKTYTFDWAGASVTEGDYAQFSKKFDLSVSVIFRAQYNVNFDLGYSNAAFEGEIGFQKQGNGYVGLRGVEYTLPTVKRPKADGTGSFTFDGWYDGTSLLKPGEKYIQSTAIQSVSLKAVYHEAELVIKDSKHDTKYLYPNKGETGMVGTNYQPEPVFGYEFGGFQAANGTIYNVGDPITYDDMVLTVIWNPVKYKIAYLPNYGTGNGEGSMSEIEKTFGENVKLSKNAFKRYGYNFAGWAFTDNASEVKLTDGATVTPELLKEYFSDNSTAVNGGTMKLYALWTQGGISFENGTSANVETVYGTEINKSLKLKSSTATQGQYTVTQGLAYMDGVEETIGNYINNFNVSTSGDQLVVSGTPITVWDGALTVQVNVKDRDAGNDAEPSVLTLSFSVEKKQLSVDTVTFTDGQGSREYDGTSALSDSQKAAMKITLSGVAAKDANQVSVSSVAAEYDSKDAGKRDIRLSKLTLGDEWTPYYEIEEDWVIKEAAEITKRPLYVTLTGEITKYVGEEVAAEANQKFAMEYDSQTSEETKQVILLDGGLTIMKDEVAVPNPEVLTVTYDFPNPTEGQVVSIDVKPESTNYKVSFVNPTCTLVVLQDKAMEDQGEEGNRGNYRIQGELGKKVGDTQWYTSVVEILPAIQHGTDYYNQIKRVGASEWGQSIRIDDESKLNGTELQFYMRNGNTGAYTTNSDTMSFNVDSQAPEIDGEVTFSATSKTSFIDNLGYFFDYGNFFKEDITATMTVKDNKSGCSRIYYKVNNAAKWTEQELNGGESDTVHINIPLGTKSELQFYLEDVAGKASPITTLVGKNGGTEWVIENTNPQIAGYYVANMEGDRISNLSSGNWYNQPVQLVAEVKESDSGIHYADWYINGDVDRQNLEDGIHRGDSDTFVKLPYRFENSGIYEVALDVTDNATNTSGKKDLTAVRIDLAAPEIHLDESQLPDTWSQAVNIPFTVTDDISGVYKVSVVSPQGESYELNPAKDGTYMLTATMAGDYTIYAKDEAYNESSKTLNFDKISNVVPKNGSVVLNPENPDGDKDGWYKTRPSVTITPAESESRVPVTTYCKLWNGGTEPQEASEITAVTQIKIPQDGIWYLKVWTETASGIKNEDQFVKTLYVDSTSPICTITKVQPSSTQQTVSFTVTDTLSGVDIDRIRVVNGNATVASKMTASSDGKTFQGTYIVTSPGNYVVEAYDKAGNLSASAVYQPMTMKVNAIKKITKTTATISSITYKGTYPIASVKYEYKKASSKQYKAVTPYLVKDTQGNVTASYSLKNLKENTKYNYRIKSVSELGEALTYTGSFKTAGAEGISISGVAVDADNSSANITVSLLEGSTVLKTTDIISGQSFEFRKVPDGNYNIMATNGLTSKTISVNINKGKVIDPKGDILITLRNGMNTKVSINGKKTPGISVSGLEDIFAYDSVNFTENDKKFIAEGGSIEFVLNVEYKAASKISQSTMKAVYKLMGKNEKADIYLDFSLTKIRTYASGAVESKKSINQLSGGVTLRITVPLSDRVVKANEKSVIRVHGGSAKVLKDLDSSAKSYTLETNQFSTYVITYKAASSSDGKSNEKDDKDSKDGDDGQGNSNGKGDGSGRKDVSDKSIRDYDSSPKTGDETPLAAMGGILIISLAGMVVLKKKHS